jgi:dienelactone hydrolase
MMLSLIAALVIAAPPQEIQLTEALHFAPRTTGGRQPVHTDPVELQLVNGTFSTQGWQRVKAGQDGRLQGNGYFYIRHDAPAPAVMILQAEGNSIAYVNGEIRPGDVYGYGYFRLPVALKQGANELLFSSGRGGVKAKLSAPEKPVYLDLSDMTLPDFLIGDRNAVHAGVVLTNASEKRLEGLTVTTTVDGAMRKTWLPVVQALSVRKVGFQVPPPTRTDRDEVECLVRVMQGETIVDEKTIKLRLRAETQAHKRTFVSEIDGSVQYYGVNPATPLANDHSRPGLVLTLHGASVEGIGQAEAYASKSWAHIIAPTNRRPYGFDWEDWGRTDAMEVLADAARRYRTDPARTYLTGHSMGGHGAWQVGSHFPDEFAAIAPSAGWATFWSYVGGGRKPMNETDPVQEVLSRAMNPSDTIALMRNLAPLPIYILHGDADDNVPVSEARLMASELQKFHSRWTLFEKKGAGHWWDDSDEPGAACVDWPAIFDLFAASRVTANNETRAVRFSTFNPEDTSSMKWATIVSQEKQMALSTIDLTCDPHLRRFAGTTANVHRLAIRVGHLEAGKPLAIDIDGTKVADIRWPLGDTLLLDKSGEGWKIAEGFPPDQKSPARSSGFKNGFDRNMIFVYGTKGNAEENAWALNRARFDAEAFYYRGNGAVDVIPDTAFGSSIDVNRSVILYGNADTNGAWRTLLPDSPIGLRRGSVRIGNGAMPGDDMAVLFVRPRPGSTVATVAAVGGTGIKGMRLTERLNYFFAGVHFPDFFVAGPEMLEKGYEGVRVAGYFDNRWDIGADLAVR